MALETQWILFIPFSKIFFGAVCHVHKVDKRDLASGGMQWQKEEMRKF